jgi:hypothetical protein
VAQVNVITVIKLYTYVKREISFVVVIDDGEAADQLADRLDGRGHVDNGRVLRNLKIKLKEK